MIYILNMDLHYLSVIGFVLVKFLQIPLKVLACLSASWKMNLFYFCFEFLNIFAFQSYFSSVFLKIFVNFLFVILIQKVGYRILLFVTRCCYSVYSFVIVQRVFVLAIGFVDVQLILLLFIFGTLNLFIFLIALNWVLLFLSLFSCSNLVKSGQMVDYIFAGNFTVLIFE